MLLVISFYIHSLLVACVEGRSFIASSERLSCCQVILVFIFIVHLSLKKGFLLLSIFLYIGEIERWSDDLSISANWRMTDETFMKYDRECKLIILPSLNLDSSLNP
jgi:hypothetical protein